MGIPPRPAAGAIGPAPLRLWAFGPTKKRGLRGLTRHFNMNESRLTLGQARGEDTVSRVSKHKVRDIDSRFLKIPCRREYRRVLL